MKYYIYRCVGDERWDTLAWLYYGDAGRAEPIISANLHVPIQITLPEGVYIRIPASPAEEDDVISKIVPPWRR